MEIISESQHQKSRAADVSWIFEHQQASRNRQQAQTNQLRSQPASEDIRVLYFERQVKELQPHKSELQTLLRLFWKSSNNSLTAVDKPQFGLKHWNEANPLFMPSIAVRWRSDV